MGLKQSSAAEMIQGAEQQQAYTALEKHLEEIKKKLSDKNNRPSKEQIKSAYEFVRLLKQKKGELEQAKSQNVERVQLHLKNLQEEFELAKQIEDELKLMAEVKIKESTFLKKPDSSDDKGTEIFFYIERLDEGKSYRLKAEGEGYRRIRTEESVDSIDSFIDDVNKNGWAGNEIEKKDSSASKKVTPKLKRGESNLDELTVKEKEVKTTQDELDAAKEVFGFDIYSRFILRVNSVNLKQALNILATGARPNTEEQWEKFGYNDFNMIHLGDTAILGYLGQISAFADKNPQVVKDINNYYLNGSTIVEYVRDRKNIDTNYTAASVFEYLSRGGALSLSEQQINDVLNEREKDPKTFKAIRNLVRMGGLDIPEVKSKEELFAQMKDRPGIKKAFAAGVDILAQSKTDFGSYMKNGGDVGKYETDKEKGKEQLSKILGEKLKGAADFSYEEALKKAKEKIKTLPADQQESAAQKLALFETPEEKKKFMDFFVFKSLNIFGSMVESNEGGGMLLEIGNTSENPFIKAISLEIGFIQALQGGFIPWIGLSIGDVFKVGNSQFLLKGGVGDLGAYFIAGADYKVGSVRSGDHDYSDVGQAAQRLGLMGNFAVTYAGGISYGGGLAYSESKIEGIDDKADVLEKVLQKFSKITKTSEIDGLNLREGFKGMNETQEKLIKENVKNILIGMGFDAAPSEKERAQIMGVMIEGKIGHFRLIAGKAAQEKGWTWSGIYLGVQFVAGFFPLPAAGVQFEKTTQEMVIDSEKRMGDDLAMLGSSKTTTEYAKAILDIKTEINIDIVFDEATSCYVISGFDPTTATIRNLGGKPVEIRFDRAKSANIKIDGDRIIVGNVGSIWARSITKQSTSNRTLCLGGTGAILDEASIPELSKNNPQGFRTKVETTEMRDLDSVQVEKSEKFYDSYIDENRRTFTKGLSIYKSKKFNAFKKMREGLDKNNLLQAKAGLIEYIMAHSGKSGEAFAHQVNAITDSHELYEILARFKDVQMIDRYVMGVAGVTKEKIQEMTQERRDNPEKFKYLSCFDVLKTPYMGDKSLDRTAAFALMANQYFPSVSSQLQQKREEVAELYKQSSQVGWTSESRNNIFGLVASYKIAKDSKNRTHSAGRGFDAMPPGVVSVADGKTYEFDPQDKPGLIAQFKAKKEYFEMMRKNILATLNKGLPEGKKINDASLNTEKFSELVEKGSVTVGGKKVELERKFVFFLYGMCFNESVGLEFGKVKAEMPGYSTKEMPVNLATGGGVESMVPKLSSRTFGIAGIAGNKKETPQVKAPEQPGQDTTPGSGDEPPAASGGQSSDTGSQGNLPGHGTVTTGDVAPHATEIAPAAPTTPTTPTPSAAPTTPTPTPSAAPTTPTPTPSAAPTTPTTPTPSAAPTTPTPTPGGNSGGITGRPGRS